MANRVENIIREVTNTKLTGKYNLAQYQDGGKRHDEKVRAINHKKVCEDIVAFADSHKYVPFYLILSMGIGQNAPRLSEAQKGYKYFDKEKVETLYNMGMAYNAYNNIENRKVSDVTARLVMAYYSKKSKDFNDFVRDLNNSKVIGKKCGSREIPFAELCKNIGIPTKDNEVIESSISLSAA